MNKFWKNQKGAVTVMVTLLLIPALLISGTGVDLARVFTAKSEVQDANQLAANSLMTQYDAMLQDVYGLFAVASTDDELNAMVTDYVNICLYGDKDPAEMGSLQLFYGADATSTVKKTQNLGQIEVLRHQIEEYAKYRAPVVIADELLAWLKQFDKLQNDTEVIQDKTYIDEKIGDLQDTMNDLYEKIKEVNQCSSAETTIIKNVNTYLGYIKTQMQQILVVRNEYVEVYDSDEFYRDEMLEDCETKWGIYLNNISSIVDGHGVINTVSPGYENDEGEWVPAEQVHYKTLDKSLKKLLEESIDTLEEYETAINKMVSLCEQFDLEKEQLSQKLNELETKLNSGECSQELVNGMRADIEAYRALLTYDVSPMGYAVSEVDAGSEGQIAKMIYALSKDNFSYGSIGDDNQVNTKKSLSLSQLTGLDGIKSFRLDAEIANRTLKGDQKIDLNVLSYYATLPASQYEYHVYPTFYKFQDQKFSSTKNPEFYQVLKEVASETDSKKSDTAKDNISKLLAVIQEKLKGMNFIPQGAGYYGSRSKDAESSQLGQSGDWSDTDAAKDAVDDGMDQVKTLGSIVANVTDALVDKMLLVTYDSEMFSCYTDPTTSETLAAGSTKTDSEESAKVRISMSGIPINTQVNYFYQSELEYLYNGNAQSAEANLAAVAGTILVVRFVFNYISTFTVEEVRNTIATIRNACSVGGPIGTAIGIAVGELARFAFALGESVLDVVNLRNGEKVPLLKNQKTWCLSLTGLANMAEKAMESVSVESKENVSTDSTGLTYMDYLRIFLLLKSEKTLAERTKQLIQYNMTNIKNTVYAENTLIYGSEGNLSKQTLYKLSAAGTAYEISTTVEMRFLFLSMGVFQKGLDGVVPPATIDVTAVDYRGY